MYYGIYWRLNLHVSASNIDVIRAARKRFKITTRTGTWLKNRAGRKDIYRALLAEHKDAQELYHAVVGGHV